MSALAKRVNTLLRRNPVAMVRIALFGDVCVANVARLLTALLTEQERAHNISFKCPSMPGDLTRKAAAALLSIPLAIGSALYAFVPQASA